MKIRVVVSDWGREYVMGEVVSHKFSLLYLFNAA